MFLGGLGGLAYYLGFSGVNWNFLPGILVALLYLSGFIGLIYALTGG